MNQIKKELLFTLSIKLPDQNILNVKINPNLTLGLDPRNDLVLISESMSLTHLAFTAQNEDLVVTQLGASGSTRIFDTLLLKDQSYLLMPSDLLFIDDIEIKITKQLGIRYSEIDRNSTPINPIRGVVNRNNIRENSDGVNLNFEIEKSSQNDISINSFSSKKEKISELKLESNMSLNKNSAKVNTDNRFFFPIYLLAIIFDFLLSYFLLGLFPQIQIKLVLFFMIQEILSLILIKNLIGLNLIQDEFFRKFGIWFLVVFFLIFPMTLSSFNKVVRPIALYKSNVIELHELSYRSQSIDNNLSLICGISPELHIIPNIKDHQFNINFYHDLISEKVEIKFDKILTIDSIKKAIVQVSDLAINEKVNKKLVEDFMLINRSTLWKFITFHGPFFNSINYLKNLFIYGLSNSIESIKFNSNTPISLYRDKYQSRLIFWGKKQVYLFTFTRPKSIQLENMIIEKVLANISNNLIDNDINELGFFEMFDTLPKINFKLLIDIYRKEVEKNIGRANLGLINFYVNQLDQLENQIQSNSTYSNNTNTEFIHSIHELKNNLIQTQDKI